MLIFPEELKVSVIIPAYNESKIIGNSLKRLCNYFDNAKMDYEVIICDDCSMDGTSKKVKMYMYSNEKITLLRFLRRIGKGGTIKNASKIANGDVLLLVDADLPIDLNSIAVVIKKAIALKTLVIGSRRVVRYGSYTILRRFLSYGYNMLVNILFRTGLRDHQVGFKAIYAKLAKEIMPKIRSDGFIFDTELIVRAKKKGVSPKVIDVKWADLRDVGESKVPPLKTLITMFMDLIALRLTFILGRELLSLKATKNGFFLDERSGQEHSIIQYHFDVRRRGLLNFLRRLYLKIAFS